MPPIPRRDVGQRMAKKMHPKTVALLRKIQEKKLSCPACGGTGEDSRGRACQPCLMNGRIK